MSGFALPDGWTSEQLSTLGHILIKSTTGLMVTIDNIERGYRAGLVTTGAMTSKRRYRGRNWNAYLILDAVQWLQRVEAEAADRIAPRAECSHCGESERVVDGVIAYHDFPKPCRRVCPGSKKAPRTTTEPAK